MRALSFSFTLLLACGGGSADSPAETTPAPTGDMAEPMAVTPPPPAPTRCPDAMPEGQERGIVIVLPAAVAVDTSAEVGMCARPGEIPICGYYSVEPPGGGAEIVITRLADGREVRGGLGDCDPSPIEPMPESHPPSEPPSLQNIIIGGAFAHNLLDNLELPPVDGRYRVHVEWGPHRSNEVELELSFH